MRELTFEVKEFIEQNIDLIEEKRWDEVYDNAEFNLDSESTGAFTKAMLDVGLDPIREQGLDYIPDYYLSDSTVTTYDIPSNVHQSDNAPNFPEQFHRCCEVSRQLS